MDFTSPQDLFGVEFDPLYSEIEATLAQQDESSDPLSMSHEQPKINWPLIAEQSTKLLEQCYDLRVALWQIRAKMHQEGVCALFRGLNKLAEKIEENREPIYPISDDNSINTGHAAALCWLSTSQCIAELKSVRLTAEHAYNIQDLFNSEFEANESNRFLTASSNSLVAVNTYFQQNGYPDLLEQFISIRNFIKKIESYANQYSDGYRLDCDQLHAFLSKHITLLSQSITNINSNGIDQDEIATLSLSTSVVNSSDINIRSRQEIIFMLDRILEYFQNYEPSHPAPIFIRRTKQMMGMDFISIVEDLLPESSSTLQLFTGK
ncbi:MULTISPECIES: type VI secretion system protein TssA [Serratia]|uniref:type VI secretion system protein TssA n=1 Tax=Serratia TaxID=613 RepID=UPI0012E21A5E|nr:type VI secretion system ImpA family N-terminal domain-containing protein [Serratia oryzae]